MITIIHFGSPKIQHIAESLEKLGLTFLIVKWDEPEKIDKKNTQAYVLSGSPILITKTDITQYLLNYNFLKEVTVPVLGVCFGHQLLGIMYGGQIFKGKNITAEMKIDILHNDVLFSGFGKTVIMFEDHTEGISLPPDFIHLASSDTYEIEAMKHPYKNIYGVQFHPEVSGDNGLKLYSNFFKLIQTP
jgi:GMP synthase (glutamine-hydrolysing)